MYRRMYAVGAWYQGWVSYFRSALLPLPQWDRAVLSAVCTSSLKTLCDWVVITRAGPRWACTLTDSCLLARHGHATEKYISFVCVCVCARISSLVYCHIKYKMHLFFFIKMLQNTHKHARTGAHVCGPHTHTRSSVSFVSHFHPFPLPCLGRLVWSKWVSLAFDHWEKALYWCWACVYACECVNMLTHNHSLSSPYVNHGSSLLFNSSRGELVPSKHSILHFDRLCDHFLALTLPSHPVVTLHPPPHFSWCLLLLFHFRILLCPPLLPHWYPLVSLIIHPQISFFQHL